MHYYYRIQLTIKTGSHKIGEYLIQLGKEWVGIWGQFSKEGIPKKKVGMQRDQDMQSTERS